MAQQSPTPSFDTSRYVREAGIALNSFYEKPVARISFELFLSLGLVIVLAIFAVKPTLTTIAELNAQIVERQDLLAKLKLKSAALQTAQSELNRNQNNLTLLNESLPPQPRLIDTLKIVEYLATEHEVLINSISVPKAPEETPATQGKSVKMQSERLPISVTVNGTYTAIHEYVEALRASRRMITVETVSFSLNEDRGSRLLQATIALDAPYYAGESS